MALTHYFEWDYQGEFNILTAERETIVKALKRKQGIIKAAKVVGLSNPTFRKKLIAHEITTKEWKAKTK